MAWNKVEKGMDFIRKFNFTTNFIHKSLIIYEFIIFVNEKKAYK